MRPHLVLRMLIYTTLTVVSAGFLMAQDLPSYMAPISGRTVSSPAETAMKNVLALNTSMFELYDSAHKIFESNILSKHPVILGLFSGAGGRFILYRPGMAPLEAPSVPIVYQVLKSVDHSTMALAQVVGPYLDNPADQSWRAPMLSYRARMQAALDGLNELSMPADWRGNDRSILQNNIAFMDDCLAKSAVSCRVGGICQEAGPASEAGHRVGGANAGRSLDESARGMEDDARCRLAEDLRGQQHDLCDASKQRVIQRAGAVFWAASHERPADPHRDDLVYHIA